LLANPPLRARCAVCVWQKRKCETEFVKRLTVGSNGIEKKLHESVHDMERRPHIKDCSSKLSYPNFWCFRSLGLAPAAN